MRGNTAVETVGFIGLGTMGREMAINLVKAEHRAQALAVPLPATALMTSQYVEARAHEEGGNGNQALFRVYDRTTNQVRN